MKQPNPLATRLREVILDGTWIANTNYKAQIDELSFEVANIKNAAQNSIAALAQHIHYYIAGIKNVFEGGELTIKDKYSFDFEPFQSENDWQRFLQKFWDDTNRLIHLIEETPEEKWENFFSKEEYGTYRRNIDGLIEHAYYHLGQIVLFKKMA